MLLKELGVDQKTLAERMGVSPSAVSYWVRNKRIPGSAEAAKIAQALGISMDALYSGRQLTTVESREDKRKGPYWGTSDEAPIVQPVSAGSAHAWIDRGHDAPRVKVNCKDPNCYAVEVWGDSMAPIYQPGDILVIAPNAQIVTNDLVVFKTEDDEPYFKKYLGEKNGVYRFASLNPNYPIMEFRKGEVKAHAVHSIIRPLKGKIF